MNLMLSGFLTGCVSAFIYTPIEYSKIKCQVSRTSNVGSISRIFQAIWKERTAGIIKLYTGLGVTLTKESFGSALYYGGFHIMISKILAYEREKAPVWAQIGAGSLAGILYQILSFPFDTIKTNVQSGRKDFKTMLKDRFWR